MESWIFPYEKKNENCELVVYALFLKYYRDLL